MKLEIDHEESRIWQRSVVEALNERRKSVDMSLRELESLSGIRHSTISDLFRKHDIRLWQVFTLAKALDMPIPQLYTLASVRYLEIVAQEYNHGE